MARERLEAEKAASAAAAEVAEFNYLQMLAGETLKGNHLGLISLHFPSPSNSGLSPPVSIDDAWPQVKPRIIRNSRFLEVRKRQLST